MNKTSQGGGRCWALTLALSLGWISCVMLRGRQRRTVCALQPQPLPSPALWMPPHLCPASVNHVPWLFRRLPVKLPSSWCFPSSLCTHPETHFTDSPSPKSSCVHIRQACATHLLKLISPKKLLLWLTLMSQLAAQAQVTFSSPSVASIASTDMRLLLQDDVFVDFFNTFLNLPVSPLHHETWGLPELSSGEPSVALRGHRKTGSMPHSGWKMRET